MTWRSLLVVVASLLIRAHALAIPMARMSYLDPCSTNVGLTAEETDELVQAIYELNDQIQYYYEAKMNELNCIRGQIQELQRLRDQQFQSQTTQELEFVEPVQASSLSNTPTKRTVKVPAKYYQNTIAAMQPNPAPGMPITAGENLYANLKASQPILTAELESMVASLKQNQPLLELSLKKNAPILTAEFESTVTAIRNKIALVQPLFVADLDAALTQTVQNQALLAAEVSQLLVDCKDMVASQVADLGACTGLDACDLM